jgi:hypothetical protein
MFARLTTIEADRDRIEEGLALLREQVVGQGPPQPGSHGAYVLVDRATAHVVTLTFWDTEEDLEASEDWAAEVRLRFADTLWTQSPPTVEVFEVAIQPQPD